MKKIFTFIAALMLSSGAFAQGEWTDLVVNGDMEGQQDPKWSSFWCHDWRRGLGDFDPDSNQQYDNDDPENGQFQGFAEIIEDPLVPGNHCARVIARSEAEADEAGNKVAANGSLASWDCQFFIYANETVSEGMEVRMTLRVRADKAGSFETQAHWTPGDYNHYVMFGNVDVTTEWQKVQVSTTLSADMCKEGDGKFFQTVAFNLSTDKEGNVFYFDDVKLEWREPKGPSDFEGWQNFLRKGTLSEDVVGNFTTFTGRDGIDGIDQKARVINDPIDGEPCLNVTSIGYNSTMMKETTTTDEEGNETTETEEVPIYIKENGDTLTNIDDWQTQFFVTVPHTFTTGQQYKLVMWARADKDCQVSTQAHVSPGNYKHWDMVGTLDLTSEWQQFVFGDEGDERTISSDQNTCHTIAFNCNMLKDEDNNIYFRFDEFSFNKADVTDEDRIIDTESISLPIPEPGNEDGITASVDFTNCMAKLYAEDLGNMLNDEHVMVLKGEDAYSEPLSAVSGFFINEQGLFDEDGKIIIEVADDSTIDNVKFNITNTGDSFADKRADTNFIFTYDGWYYKYMVNFVPEDVYNGIAEIKADKQRNATVYDLSGRKVKSVTKGLYILDGKKYIVK